MCFIFAWNSRGLRFYQGLEKTVLKLEEKLKEFYEGRKKEMAKIEEKEKKAKGNQQINIVQYFISVLRNNSAWYKFCVFHFCD